MRNLARRIAAVAVLAALLVVPGTREVASSAAGTVAVATSAVAPAATTATLDVRGTGAWQRFACLGCVAGFLFVSGTGSVAAVIAVMAAYPEVAALCAAGCYAAFAI